MGLQVQCYAGRNADERPVRFQLKDRDFIVEEVLDQWYGPDDLFFKVRAMTAISTFSPMRSLRSGSTARMSLCQLGLDPRRPPLSPSAPASLQAPIGWSS